MAPFGPFLSPGDSREGPTCIQNCSTQCIWVIRIHITPLGPLTDLYGTPGPSKRALLAPKGPVGGPIGSRRAPGDQIWSQLLPIGLTGLESWLPDTLTWYLASSGPPGPSKGPVLAPKGAQIGSKLKIVGNLSCDLSKFAQEDHSANGENITMIRCTS